MTRRRPPLFLPSFLLLSFFSTLTTISTTTSATTSYTYEPTWSSLDSRPLPSWYDDAKFGIFIHWGVYSVPAFRGEWFWWYWQGISPDPAVVEFMERNYPPNWTYQDFAPQFSASLFDPQAWAELFQAAGARYVVLTSKHHEGYAMYPSKYMANWNSKDVGPGRDLVGELAAAIRNTNQSQLHSNNNKNNKNKIHFGLYHSLYEWFHPLYLNDKANGYTTQEFVQQKIVPEMMELVQKYQPEILWSDGGWEAPSDYWNSTHFLAWLYNESPVRDVLVTNDRWGNDTSCQHGGFYSCDDRFLPGTLQAHKYESCQTLDKSSWGYRKEATLADFLTFGEVLHLLVTTVATGGNLLLNVGPDKDGMIHPIFEERLRSLGRWLDVYGEGAIYGSKPWRTANDTVMEHVWYTTTATANVNDGNVNVNAIVLCFSGEGGSPEELVLGAPQVPPDLELWGGDEMMSLSGGNNDAAALVGRRRRHQRRRRRRGLSAAASPTVSLVGCDGGQDLPWRKMQKTGVDDGEGAGGIVIDLRPAAACLWNKPEGWAWVFRLQNGFF